MKKLRILRGFMTIDGLFGLSIVLSLLVFTLTLIGGDGHFLIWVADWFARIGDMNEAGGTSGGMVYHIADFFYGLASFLQGLGSESWSQFFIPVFGENSFTGVELFSHKNSMKINALITFVPIFFIILLVVFRVLPKMLLGAILSPFKAIKPTKSIKAQPKRKSLLESFFQFGEKSGLMDKSHDIMNKFRRVAYA